MAGEVFDRVIVCRFKATPPLPGEAGSKQEDDLCVSALKKFCQFRREGALQRAPSISANIVYLSETVSALMKITFLLIAASFLVAETLPAVDWRPVDASELAQKTPRVDPAADAEAIFWDVRIEDKLQGQDFSLSLIHYIRIKIFTDLGREKYATVEIPVYGKRVITDVAGRTIKADGTVIDLKKDGIFERDLVKTKGARRRGTTFTLPNVAAGDIIEYRYKEIRDKEIASHLQLYFQREMPLWSVTYHLKPLNLPWQPYAMRSMAFQCDHPPFKQEMNGFYTTSMTNVPAFQEEPDMPPEDTLRAWVLIYYEEDKKIEPAKYWKDLGKSDYSEFKSRTNPDGAVKRTAAEVTSGLDKDADKLAALDRFCRTKIRNIYSTVDPMTSAERKAVKENHSPADTLKQQAGTGEDVDLLFAALAKGAGFDARMARVSDRSNFFFNASRPTTYFLVARDVAVKSGDKWLFFDPATTFLEPGMLRWQEEDAAALIADPKEGILVTTTFLDASRSKRTRRGTFKLLDDGTLEGSVEYTYTGHSGRHQKTRFQDMIPAQQEKDLKESLKDRLSTAEISDFDIKGVRDNESPVVVKYKVTVPAYAARTGKRILLQPAFFQRNLAPRFTDSKRKWDVYFDYGWAEDDEVTIDLPEGWEMDQPVAPTNTTFGELGSYSVRVLKSNGGRKLIYRRAFDFGRASQLLLPAKSYPAVKKAFDFVQEQDGYTIALKAVAGAK